MALVKVPTEQQWLQPNTSVLYGNIFASRNVDFSLPGFLKLAPRTSYVYRENTSGSTFDYLLAIAYGAFGGTTGSFGATNLYYFITSDGIYAGLESLASVAVLTNASAPSPALSSTDAVAFNNALWVTTSNNLHSLTGGVWSAGLYALTAGIPHPLAVSPELDSLLIGNGNLLQRRTAGGSNTTVVTLPTFQRIQWVRVFNQSCWIGTRNLNNGQAAVYQWDQSAANFNQEYLVDCSWIFSGVSWNGNLYIFTADGRLMSFNGAGFSEVSRLPAYTDLLATSDYTWQGSFSLGSVFQRGMEIIDGLPHVLLNSNAFDNGVAEDATNRMSSGIWVFDPNIGFHHKYAPSYSNSEQDYGQMILDAGAGAIAPVLQDPTASGAIISATTGGTLLFGARLSSNTSIDYYTLCSAVTGNNVGQVQTTRIESPGMQESWQYVFLKFEEFESASNKIIVKYRTKYRQNLPFTTNTNVTWTSNTTFTTTDTRFANVLVGDEVTVASGSGAGLSAHVLTITFNTGTYTVVLDEAIANVVASDIAKVIVDNFTKLSPVISTATIDNTEVYARSAKIKIPVDIDSTNQPAPAEWIELKAEMRGNPKSMLITNFSVLSETQIKEIV